MDIEKNFKNIFFEAIKEDINTELELEKIIDNSDGNNSIYIFLNNSFRQTSKNILEIFDNIISEDEAYFEGIFNSIDSSSIPFVDKEIYDVAINYLERLNEVGKINCFSYIAKNGNATVLYTSNEISSFEEALKKAGYIIETNEEREKYGLEPIKEYEHN